MTIVPVLVTLAFNFYQQKSADWKFEETVFPSVVMEASSSEKGEILSATVKIVSYSLTKNNHVLENSLASGTIISADGLILTNHHVVTNEQEETYEAFSICTVTDSKEKPSCRHTAEFVAKDKGLDIALLQISETDVFGNPIETLPFLSTKNDAMPDIDQRITVLGFPGIGGETITSTKGQISGYEEVEGITRLKTDATISTGNSGGTVLDQEGHFIGVPSYLRAHYGTLGYIIPLSVLQDFLAQYKKTEPESPPFARELLQALLKKQYDTETSRHYVSTRFPFYEMNIPKPWKIRFLNETNLVLENSVQGYEVKLLINQGQVPYEIDDTLFQILLRKLEKNKHQLTNYHRQKKTFRGLEGYQIQYDMNNNRLYAFFGRTDNSTLSYLYNVSLENPETTQNASETVLETLQIIPKANNNPKFLQTYEQTHPNIQLKTTDDFYISPIYDSNYEDVIVQIHCSSSYEQEFLIQEEVLAQELWDLPLEEILEEELKNVSGSSLSSLMGQDGSHFRLTNKYTDVVIDGLPGYAYTQTYQGDAFNKTRKKTQVVVFKKHAYFRFTYDDLEDKYDKNIGKVLAILRSFQYDGPENQEKKGTYNIPNFEMFYEDLKNHLYEKQINALVSMNIWPVAKDRYFYPDRPAERLEVVRTIVESMKFVEQGQNLSDTQKALDAVDTTPIFEDIQNDETQRLLHFAIEKGMIDRKNFFRPEKSVTVADVYRMIFQAYQVPVWTPPYKDEIPKSVPYAYKAIQLGIYPLDVVDDEAEITRGQLASVIYDFIKVAGERNDF